MAEGKNNIIVYRDWITTFEALTDEEAGRLIKHFFRYVNDQNPVPEDRITGLLFEPIKQKLKRDLKLYEAKCLKNKENVEVRWNKENTNEYERIRTDTKHTDIDIDKDIDIDNDKEKKYKNIPPLLEEVKNRIYERGIIKFTAEKFYAFYSSKGWMIGKNKMKNWDAALTTWNNKDYENNSGTGKRSVKRVNDYWNNEGAISPVPDEHRS